MTSSFKKPRTKPARPYFSSGPVAKFKGWDAAHLATPLLGRSHRSGPANGCIQDALARIRTLLQLPQDYEIALIPGSATGAMSAAMWNFLGLSGVDVWAFDVFGGRWAEDVRYALKLGNARFFETPMGVMPPLEKADFNRDQVFVWNGTTSGLWLQNQNWIPSKRTGLTLCDATSAVLCCDLPWNLFDVTAFSFQKGFGSEAGLGVLVLSPKALEHLRTYVPSWPIPRALRLTQKGRLNEGLIFKGETLNTLSLLTLQDVCLSLDWIDKEGGLQGILKRVARNTQALNEALSLAPLFDFVVEAPAWRSQSSVCLTVKDESFIALSTQQKWIVLRKTAQLLEKEQVAFDILGHGVAPPCFRLWTGPTVEAEDITCVIPWLAWAFESVLTTEVKNLKPSVMEDAKTEDIDFKENLPYNKKDDRRKGRKHVF